MLTSKWNLATGLFPATAVAVTLCIAPGSAAADGRVNTGYFGGVAIDGYDPVAYFTDGRAVKGSAEFRHEFLGETWHFASATNRDAFAADPAAYAPQYGGYCAGEMTFADVSTGITTNIDPEAWRIIDGKLYLFYDSGYAEVFEKNAGELIEKADSEWPKVEARLMAR
jgi:YHS domain-containing protein